MKRIPSAPARASCASTTSARPFFCSSPTESRATRGALDPEDGPAEGGAEEGELDQVLRADVGVGADSRGRAAAAPSAPGTGICTASAGRWTPCARFSANSAAVIVAPGGAGARQRAAAAPRRPPRRPGRPRPPGVARTAATGSASLPIHSVVGLHARRRRAGSASPGRRRAPGCRRPRPAGRPRAPARARRPPRRRRARRARHHGLSPAARAARPAARWRRAPRADHLTPRVGPAGGADAMRQARAVAARALVQARRRDLVLGAPLVAPRARLSLLGDRHRRRGW